MSAIVWNHKYIPNFHSLIVFAQEKNKFVFITLERCQTFTNSEKIDLLAKAQSWWYYYIDADTYSTRKTVGSPRTVAANRIGPRYNLFKTFNLYIV